MPNPQTKPDPTPKKRTKPVPSPEFAQARCKRDLRLIDERIAKLNRVHQEKLAAIAVARRTIAEELAAVEKKLSPEPGS